MSAIFRLNNRYYDTRRAVKYVLSAKELTDLAKEVAAEVVFAFEDSGGTLDVPAVETRVQIVLAERGIAWEEGS